MSEEIRRCIKETQVEHLNDSKLHENAIQISSQQIKYPANIERTKLFSSLKSNLNCYYKGLIFDSKKHEKIYKSLLY